MRDVLILTTGGTIDKLYYDALSDYRIGTSVVGQLLCAARVTRPFRVCELMRKDSLDLCEADRDLIVAAVTEATETAVVVTHGTDTMTDTARALTGVVGKTVVLVGALSPARFAESDATFNLGMAFAAAQMASPGIYIAMNGVVSPASSVRKDRSANSFVRV